MIRLQITRKVKLFLHKLRVIFTDACPDINCTGTMQLYDNKVFNDYCSVCGRTESMIADGVKPAHSD